VCVCVCVHARACVYAYQNCLAVMVTSLAYAGSVMTRTVIHAS